MAEGAHAAPANQGRVPIPPVHAFKEHPGDAAMDFGQGMKRFDMIQRTGAALDDGMKCSFLCANLGTDGWEAASQRPSGSLWKRWNQTSDPDAKLPRPGQDLPGGRKPEGDSSMEGCL